MLNEPPPDTNQLSPIDLFGSIPTKRDDILKQTEFREQSYNPQKKHDTVRAHITYILLSILAGTLTLIFAIFILSLFLGNATATWASLKDMLQILLPAETGLIGSAVGFYFGSQLQLDRSQRP
jgi:hypothetical protein